MTKENKRIPKGTCSIDNPNKDNEDTCYDLEFLKKMRRKISSKLGIEIPDSDDLQELYSNIQKAVANKVKCKNEACLLEVSGYQDYYSKFFAPIAPQEWAKKKITYLNTLHIEEVCKKIPNLYPLFAYLGTSPIDFDTQLGGGSFVHDVISKTDIKKLEKMNKTCFGAVFNTDPHYREGEHWVSLFVSIKDKKICYYDSYGFQPGAEIKAYMNRLHKQFGNGAKIFYNNIPQQKKGTECGMYCIMFLLNMAKTGGDFVYTVNNMPSDDELNSKRAEFFNLIGDNDD
jgi:hypothetical protein